ncbi:MAG: hypothetical protein M1821_008056 [Bathelium mastoideum]|nr:MAG: hypothetical protein M1821_008056 [Bathelium mastoideum]KAI9693100.1 MAG: hypothetical protein M1822_005095 [Bathelium mastoideum]
MVSSTKTSSRPYFGYGSNLWQHQMSLRCPRSTYLGIARLKDYRWIINARGYANVVEIPKEEKSTGAHEKDVVWGLVYGLTGDDEKRLDGNEGVPDSYTKEVMSVEFWDERGKKGDEKAIDVLKKPEPRDVLVYIDRKRTSGDYKPKSEYVHRMNMGIADALKEGVPEAYVHKVLRKWIPEEEDEDKQEADLGGEARTVRVKQLAEQQARQFVEEDEGT